MLVQDILDNTLMTTPMVFTREHSTFYEAFNCNGASDPRDLMQFAKEYGNRKVKRLGVKEPNRLWVVIY